MSVPVPESIFELAGAHHQWACHILGCEDEVDYTPPVEKEFRTEVDQTLE